jgi:hypothetical protein
MMLKNTLFSTAYLHLALQHASAAPTPQTSPSQALANTTYGPIPGESSIYSNYSGVAAPFPANLTSPIFNTTSGPPGPDDLLWQNLLSAEWIIYAFYQKAVTLFNSTSFTSLGLPNTTYSRIMEIRDNEAGHLRIFQDQISSTSIKPGACEYTYPFSTPEEFLPLVSFIEISSMAFLTGLVQQATLNSSEAALTAISATESRHNTWTLIDIWNISPFAGPSDTVYPYANQILDSTRVFIVPGSCPAENPEYPSPSQNLPRFGVVNGTTSVAPGSVITVQFEDPTNQPSFSEDKDYWAVFFHGVENISVPFDTKTNTTTIPKEFDTLGLIVSVIADEQGAPTQESCIAGPEMLLQQPEQFGAFLA